MNPVFGETTAVLVKPIPYANIEPGDVIVFEYRGNLVAHRAIRKVGGRWITQGDNNSKRDTIKVSISNYRGWVYIDSNTKLGDEIIGHQNSDKREHGQKSPLPPAPPTPPQQIYLHVDGSQYGPYDQETIDSLLSEGSLFPNDWIWIEGAENWIPLSTYLNTLKNAEQDVRDQSP